MVPDPASYVFQTSASDMEITKALAVYLQVNKLNKLAMIAATDTTGEANASRRLAAARPRRVRLMDVVLPGR